MSRADVARNFTANYCVNFSANYCAKFCDLGAANGGRAQFIGQRFGKRGDAALEITKRGTRATSARAACCARFATFAATSGATSVAWGTRTRVAAAAFAARHESAANNAAVLFFELPQAWKRARQAQLFGISGVHAGDKRGHQVREQVAAKFAADERGNRLVSRRRLGARERLAENAQLGAPADQRRREKFRGAQGRAHQASAQQNVARSAWIGAQDFGRRGPIRRLASRAAGSRKNFAGRRRNRIRPFRSGR